MSTALAPVSSDLLSQIVLKGDLSGLRPEEKVTYYKGYCERVGLDPLTQPFQLLRLNGKEVLYASKSATEQLSRLHGVSHDIRDRQFYEGVFVVYVRATGKDGRYTDSSGAVTTSGLKGDALANAMMKAETKAKRRATLSLLGLGMLDETEVETIPGAERVEMPPAAIIKGESAEVVDDAQKHLADRPAASPEQTNADGASHEAQKASPADAVRHPSEAQLKRMFAIAKAEGLSNDDLKTALSTRYKVKESKELTAEQYKELCGDNGKRGLIHRMAVCDPAAEELPPFPLAVKRANDTLVVMLEQITEVKTPEDKARMAKAVDVQFGERTITLEQSVILRNRIDAK